MTLIYFLYILVRTLEAASCIVGFLYFNKIRNYYWRLFPFYLAFITIGEFIGSYLGGNANKVFYNDIVTPIEFLFFFWMFYSAFKNRKNQYIPIACVIIYFVSRLIDSLYFSTKHNWFFSFSYTIGTLLLLILILMFFIQLVTSDEIVTFRKNMLFWVCLGLLIFYLGSFPYYCLINILEYSHISIMSNYKLVVMGFNSLMYLMFIFSFIWGKPKYQSLSH